MHLLVCDLKVILITKMDHTFTQSYIHAQIDHSSLGNSAELNKVLDLW